jgi:hypothetical protein
VALPMILFLVAWQDMDLEEAGLIASWPAFLMWPVGALLIVAGLSGRLIRHLDDRRPADEVDGSIR